MPPILARPLDKVTALVNFLANSCVFAAFFRSRAVPNSNGSQASIRQPTVTRWMSQFSMIESSIKHKVALTAAAHDYNDDASLIRGNRGKLPILTTADWVVLEQLLKVYLPFNDLFQILQTSHLNTISNFRSLYNQIEEKLRPVVYETPLLDGSTGDSKPVRGCFAE